jgi:hypothetical protein
MKYKYPLVVISALLFASCFGGCKKYIQVAPPINQLVTSQIFSSVSNATTAQLDIYYQMLSSIASYEMSLDNGLLADEFMNYSTSTSQLAYYQDAMSANPSLGVFGSWVGPYQYIYRANAIIAGLANNNAIPVAINNQLTGESKFIRAFWYFYLVNQYGDVPLATTTDYTVNASLARTPKALVYQQMVSDLTDAENLLNANYLDASDTTVTTERVRPTKSVAAALLARVYLYTGKYDSAAQQASLVINNPLYQLIKPLTPANYAFTKNNTEAIWQLQLNSSFSNGNTTDGSSYILTAAPSSVSLSTQLMSSFEAGDVRRSVWVDSIIAGGATYYYPYKYHVNSVNANVNNITEYEMVLRLAEQYLIRSEAEANLGDSTDAITDLNVIRNRAGLQNYNSAINGPLLQAILHERQVELFTEWGHRWFDLIRTGNVNNVMGAPGNVCQAKGGIWNPDQVLYPIPFTDLATDPNITQNRGY